MVPFCKLIYGTTLITQHSKLETWLKAHYLWIVEVSLSSNILDVLESALFAGILQIYGRVYCRHCTRD